jgi:hypothetical protein
VTFERPSWVMTRNTQVEQIASAVHSEAGHSILAYFPRALSRLRRFGEFFELFRRLFVVICVPSPCRTYWSEFLRENVGIQFLSLRQRVLVQNSLSPYKRAKIPNKHGPSHINLRTATQQRRPKILSLRPFFSKPPDFANLVQNL